MTKVFVFGIDGAAPELIFDKWLEYLPNIKRLMQTGSYAKLNSTIPPTTIMAWNAMISGKDPSELGVFSYTYRDKDGKSKLVNSQSLKCKLLWDYLAEAGKKGVSLFVPLSYPVKQIEGAVISGFLTPGYNDKCAFPQKILEKIKSIENSDMLFDVAVGLAGHKSLDVKDLLEKTYEMTKKQISIVKEMLVEEKWDAFMSVMIGTDRLQHMIWRHFDETHRRFIPNSEFKDALRDFYIYLDHELGEILKMLDKDTTVLVVSDHGMVKQEGKININNWLMEKGYLTLTDEFRCEIEENKLEGKRTRIKYEGIDMERTFAYGAGAYNARIFLNKDKIEDTESFKQKISEELRAIKGDEGQELKTEVFFAENIYQKPEVEGCPDITIYFDELRWASNPDFGSDGLYSWQTALGADSAGHSKQGCFIINGKGFENNGFFGEINIQQIAPTLLSILDIPIPSDIKVEAIKVKSDSYDTDNLSGLNPCNTSLSENHEWEDKVLEDYRTIQKVFQEQGTKVGIGFVSEKMGEHEDFFREVFMFLEGLFTGKMRLDGKTPLVFHSVYITKLLYDCGENDLDVLLTAALHDVLEDTSFTEKELAQENFVQRREHIFDWLKYLTEDKNLPREPEKGKLPQRYVEHISRLVSAPEKIKNIEILDRFCDLMDLGYLINLPGEQRKFRLHSKLLKVKSFVENIIRNTSNINEKCLSLFNHKLSEVEKKFDIEGEFVFVDSKKSSFPEDSTNVETITKKMESTYYPESSLVDTVDGIQCKVYATSHPNGNIIVKPKYIPSEMMEFVGLKRRYILENCMTRFNLFNSKEIVKENLRRLENKFPYIKYESASHNNWFLVIPKEKIKKFHDPQRGVRELYKVPKSDLDPYLTATRQLLDLIIQGGVPLEDLGVSHSTLLGNYTPGKSDIDILVFGKENGWRLLNYLETVEHPLLSWKTKEDWAKYYHDRIVSKQFSEEEYVHNMVRKRDDGYFAGNVFSIFVVEKEDELWYDWDSQRTPLGTVKIKGVIDDASQSHVRPGYYGLRESEILDSDLQLDKNRPIQRIVTWSRPFVLQAKIGEQVEAVGLLEKVKNENGEYYQIVLGYFDTYTSERGEKEYLKALL